MDKFKERYKLPKQTQEEREEMNKPIISRWWISNQQTAHKESPNPGDFIREFYKIFKEIISILHKHLQKIEEERIFSNLFYDISIRQKPKLNKDITSKGKPQTNIPRENRHKNL